ncbi:MAG: VWA domain-containing protein [Magnetococcales bacterium]|nr:VWA domain-containing protein [Magnetococcales bacterium]
MVEQGWHFIRPLWLWSLLPMLVILWRLWRVTREGQEWRAVCDAHLLPHLLRVGGERRERTWFWLLAVGLLGLVLVLAGPTWSRVPAPLFRPQEALVVVLDLSRSMRVADVLPSRLERAKQKIQDLLQRLGPGQTGLVVFAGDAFITAPLTDDVDTVTALLASLEPDLMPIQGSMPHRGLEQALKVLERTVVNQGAVLLVTDGDAAPSSSLEVARRLARRGFRLSVLGVGSALGGPIPDSSGGFVPDRQGRPVLAPLVSEPLAALARMGGGVYATLTPDGQDLERLMPGLAHGGTLGPAQASRAMTEIWDEQGPWLLVILLPLAAMAFRRGWLLGLWMVFYLVQPGPAWAWEWDDLWLRPDQRARRALEAGDAARAADLFQDPGWRGMALSQAGQHALAAESFARWESADGHYNRGNALAQQGKLQEALQAYEQALAMNPAMEDAKANRQLVQKVLEKQQQQQKQKQQGQQQQQQQQNKSGSDREKQSQDQAAADAQKKESGEKNQSASDAQKKASGEKDQSTSDAQKKEPEEQEKSAAEGQSKKPEGQEKSAAEGQDKEQEEKEKSAADGRNKELEEKENSVADGQDKEQKEKEKTATDGQDKEQEEKEKFFAKSGQNQEIKKREDKKNSAKARQAEATPLDAENRQAMEQWLQRIPDDPGGLLRRKFLLEQRRRGRPAEVTEPW